MVKASVWERFLKVQEIKEKIRLEKEAGKKRRKEIIEKYAQKRKLERESVEILETKLDREEKEKKIVRTYHIKPKKKEEFIFTEEEKVRCRRKTLDQLVDEIGSSQLVCPPGKELKKNIDPRELTVDLTCFRKRVRRKSPEEIVALYDRLLAADPERLCKEKKE